MEACGASGGDGFWQKGASGGRGAKVRGMLRLEKGDKLRIVVGQRGLTEGNHKHGSGGGGTFVFRPTKPTDRLILAAGGGGGGSQVDGLPGNDQPNGSGNAAGSNGNGGIVCRHFDGHFPRRTLGLELASIRAGDVCWICTTIATIVNVKKEGDLWMAIFKVVTVKIVAVTVDLVAVALAVIPLEEVAGIPGEEWQTIGRPEEVDRTFLVITTNGTQLKEDVMRGTGMFLSSL